MVAAAGEVPKRDLRRVRSGNEDRSSACIACFSGSESASSAWKTKVFGSESDSRSRRNWLTDPATKRIAPVLRIENVRRIRSKVAERAALQSRRPDTFCPQVAWTNRGSGSNFLWDQARAQPEPVQVRMRSMQRSTVNSWHRWSERLLPVGPCGKIDRTVAAYELLRGSNITISGPKIFSTRGIDRVP